VAGGLQKIINTASQTLLYEFKVTGKASKPKIETVPAPVVSEGVARLFGSMLKGENLGDVLNKPDGPQPKK